MSGNPFRPNTKRVRIQTPPPLSPDSLSPDGEDSYIQRLGPDGHSGSPPPSPFSSDSSPITRDPFSQDFAEDVVSTEALENTRRNAGQSSDLSRSKSLSSKPPTPTGYKRSVPTLSNPQPPSNPSTRESSTEGQQSQPRNVSNPFRRTLENIEPPEGLRSSEQSSSSANPTEAHSTAPLDVDSFTRMMIGGRQSENADSAAPSDGSPRNQKAKPALPRHRYGKSLAINGQAANADTSPQSPILDTKALRSGQSKPPASKAPPPPPPPRRSGTATLRNSSGASSDQTSISETASSASSPPPGDESPPYETNPYRRYMRERSKSNASR